MRKERINYEIDKIVKSVPKQKQRFLEKLIREAINKAQDDGFMKGYEYAVRLLEESRVKR